MQIYLDNSATTKPYAEVVDLMAENMTSNFGNPSSLHNLGFSAEQAVKKARTQLAGLMKISEKELFFTSGGSEANTTAILGAAYARKKEGNKIITTKIEHPSVLEVMKKLEKEGFDIVMLDVDDVGAISIKDLEREIDDRTILISVMAVNNEIGTIQPISEIAELKEDYNKKHEKRIIFHSDFVQALAKVDIPTANVDIITVSGHKIHASKGIGAIFVRSGIAIAPLILGGGQESGFRSGTENVPAIVGFGKAAEIAAQNMEARTSHIEKMRKRLLDGIMQNIENIKINGSQIATRTFTRGNSVSSILNVSFLGVRAEVLLHTLEQLDIYVSTGSACSSHSKQKSHVLSAMGLSEKEIEGAIRFSLSEFNSEEEIDFTVEKLIEAVDKIRRLGSFR